MTLWKQYADSLEQFQDEWNRQKELEDSRRKARQGIEELLERDDLDYLRNLFLLTHEKMPKKGQAA